MSKIVQYGHWVVPITLSAMGLHELLLVRTASSMFVWDLFHALLFFAAALGVFYWKPLGLGVAIGICGWNIAEYLPGPFHPASSATRLAMGLLLCLSLFWFALPGVRRQFHSGNHTS